MAVATCLWTTMYLDVVGTSAGSYDTLRHWWPFHVFVESQRAHVPSL